MINWFKRILEHSNTPVKLNIQWPMTVAVDALLELYRKPYGREEYTRPTFIYYEITPLELEYISDAIDMILVKDD